MTERIYATTGGFIAWRYQETHQRMLTLIRASMNPKLSPLKTASKARSLIIALALSFATTNAQTAHKKTDTQQELVRDRKSVV